MSRALLTEGQLAARTLRSLLQEDDIFDNGDGTITMPAATGLRLYKIIADSAYL